jgi:TFIIF-interacting CTD phosphatase-like protein
MNIILDLDGTLIDQYTLRPYIKNFLLFCFKEFDTVSLWTSTSEQWLYQVINHLAPILNEISCRLRKHCTFHYTFFDKHCTYRNNIIIKPLIYMNDLSLSNTIIVDDSIYSFVDNPDNGVYIPTFSSNNINIDNHLQILIPKLQNIIYGVIPMDLS